MDWAFDKQAMVEFCDLLFGQETMYEDLVFFTDVSFKKLSPEFFEIRYSRWDAKKDEYISFADYPIPVSGLICHRFIKMHKNHIISMAKYLKDNERFGDYRSEGIPWEPCDNYVDFEGFSIHELNEEQKELLSGILREKIEDALYGISYEDMVDEPVESRGHPEFIEKILLDIKRECLEKMVDKQ